MIRQTSIDVYHQIEAEGLLSKLRLEVYKALFKSGPCTALELYSRAFKGTHRDHSITPRFSELEASGVIRSVGETKCKISGRTVILWDVTSKLPEKIKKPTKIKCKHCNGKGFFIQERLL